MRIRAKTTVEPISHIVSNLLRRIPREYNEYLPVISSLKQTLQRDRRNAGVSTLALHQNTVSGEPFLRYNEDGMMIFAADSDLQFLANADDMFGKDYKEYISLLTKFYREHGYRGIQCGM